MLIASISQLIPEGDRLPDRGGGAGSERGTDVSFIDVGDGPCAGEYKEKVERLGIQSASFLPAC